MEEPKVAGLRTRGRGSDASVRSAALERLKALRSSGGRRSDAGAALQVKMEAPIYDVVEEDDYAALVASRREKASGFIVDDDGLGYADDGQEEDWSNPNLVYSSGDEEEPSGGEEEQPKRRKAPKMDPALKKPPPSSLTAAAAMMGKQRLSSMFTSSIFKKNDRVKGSSMSSESIVDDVIAEFAPDETDREKRRRNAVNNVAPTTITTLPVVQIKAEMQQPLAINSYNVEFKPSDEEPLVKSGECQANDDKGQVKDVDMETHGKDLASMAVPASNESLNEANNEANLHAKMEDPKRSSLNATIKVENDGSMISATADWRAVCHDGGVGPEGEVTETKANFDSDDKFEFTLEADGSLPFYIIDAHEETSGGNSGILYLFGKVKAGSGYHSCCIIVKNMQRCVYAIPKDSVFDSINIDGRNSPKSQMSEATLGETLQDMASEMKNEVAQHLLDINVSTFSMMPVKRNYAFERSDIPSGEQYVLKINYPFKDPPLPADLRGKKFLALLGTHTSSLELFIIKRKIKGPSWLSISKFMICPAGQRVSWCKLEIIVDCPKDIRISTSKTLLDPPVVVTAINLKTVINEKNNENEIVTASVVCCHKAKIDGPMVPSEWKNRGALTHFSIVRKLEGGIFPMGMTKEVSERNSRAGTSTLALESSERALLNRLMIELNKLDSDVLVGHNISGFDLDVLLRRAQVCKVPSATWSKIGRLKRYSMPKLTKGSGFYGSGATPGIMSCIAGRLLCDTYLCSRDLLREVSYSLTQLAKTQLNKDRKEISPHDIPSMFQSTTMLLELVEYGETDAWLSLELMFHLSVLPLTRQLTNISGNLWGKTLQGARAQRVEYLLLHAFHAKKYITPDKISSRTKELNTTKRKSINCQDGDEDGATKDHESIDIDAHHIDQSKGKKGPAYAGGLVLEPKKGLYDKLILLLDFNSLYPSIIQEYNICFTTVERSPEGLIPNLPSSKIPGVLPELLRDLVERRRMVKSWLKTASRLKIQQLDIQQQALKLTANSMYGCLGFSNSRFYAKPLAELITLQGREILQSTVDLVQNNLNLEVIYGDTDSIMIYSGLDDINKARAIAGKVIQEVNKKYRRLEIDLDGLYKRMLLLKKKKYAAVKVLFKDGMPYEVIERKGLDMVRRDWSLLSKEIGDYCLRQILSGGTCEDVVESIHSSLIKVQEDMRNGEVALEKYVITKTLTKPPEDYPDAKNQPHVQVALRLKKNGHTGCSAGDTVPYIICCQQENFSSSTGIAQRARHPDELKRDGGWMIDIDYYLSQQIHPVVSRLCASIQGTSPARLADCLGLDSAKFQFKEPESVGQDPSSVLSAIIDIEERFRGCEPLRLSCSSCSSTFDCPPISSLLSSIHKKPSDSQAEEQSDPNFWQRMRCPRCPDHIEGCKFSPAMLANQVKRQADNFIYLYYKGLMMCDDEICKYTTRSVNLRVIGDSERGTVCPNYPHCNGHLIRQYTEKDLYKQLSYFCHVLDASNFAEKLDQNVKLSIEKELAAIRPAVSLAESVIQKIRDRCSYGWVQLKDLCISV
ncbi:DNA polymerase alpha catalytic subunit-like [Zingiber officinale]|uniref:DNA polymerase alpha catalytic subunit-like n=1 Tax=Zingiber officinale TaxID=94328 RepID=UPI001C4BB8C3|nr:DNA polymerase alpha catalytic subunit-like [Zingiber officinale]XP_042427208.1 DNA polymerase alpha catalytic subunit-like [Zingiber officinale]